jgi:uncharacterized protein (DUF58 family)
MSAEGDASIPLRLRLLALAERRLPSLTRLRAIESLPIRLHRRRIYVLPTRFGLGFALLLLIMQLGALNYSNNAALLLTCILGAAAWISLFAGFRGLAGVELQALAGVDGHAGTPLELHLHFAASPRDRPGLRLRIDGVETAFALARGQTRHVTVQITADRRGWRRLGRIKLWTEQPLGLFVVWSWLNPESAMLVYPQIEHAAPPLPPATGRHGARAVSGDGDDFSGLRDYRSGDPQRRIAWKASARHDGLLVRENEILIDDNRHLDYASLHGLDHEARIRRLTAWVLAAEQSMLGYTLSLPRQRIGPGLGHPHRHACLRALALLPDAP